MASPFSRQNGNVAAGITVFFVLCIIWFVYQIFRAAAKGPDVSVSEVDQLNQIQFHIGDMAISWWPVTHFLMYLILGFLFPNYWPVFVLVGIAWELFEYGVGKTMASFPDATPKRFDRVMNVEYETWIQGNWKDVLFNTAGLVVGVGLRSLVSGV